MQCKIDHTSADSVPLTLCRACHPELSMHTTEREALDKADRDAQRAASERKSRERELAKAQTKLASLTRTREPDEGSVNAKIAKSMRKKIHRLERELTQ